MTKEIKERLQVESEKEAIARQVFYEVKKLFKHYHSDTASLIWKDVDSLEKTYFDDSEFYNGRIVVVDSGLIKQED